jgi:hypothetical protein
VEAEAQLIRLIVARRSLPNKLKLSASRDKPRPPSRRFNPAATVRGPSSRAVSSSRGTPGPDSRQNVFSYGAITHAARPVK